MKYCIWNNKGGVGKTFLTYCLSTEYAKKHPDECVVVVDMCPQSNVSEMLLGGNGKGADNLFSLYERKLTIADYIVKKLERPYEKSLMGNEISYFITPKDYNMNMPDNLRLVAGSSDVDMYSRGIEFFANSGRQANQKDAWKTIKSWLKDLLDSYVRNKTHEYKKIVFFIDCNPSFSSYTELAFVAADRLIIPCNADGASIRALHNVFKMVYGVDAEQDYIASFSNGIKEYDMSLPRIALVVQNRNRTNRKQPSKAFSGVMSSIDEVIDKYLRDSPELFISANSHLYNVKDCNTLAPIISYNGLVLSEVSVNSKHKVYDTDTIANASQLDPIKKDIDLIIDTLSVD